MSREQQPVSLREIKRPYSTNITLFPKIPIVVDETFGIRLLKAIPQCPIYIAADRRIPIVFDDSCDEKKKTEQEHLQPGVGGFNIRMGSKITPTVYIGEDYELSLTNVSRSRIHLVVKSSRSQPQIEVLQPNSDLVTYLQQFPQRSV